MGVRIKSAYLNPSCHPPGQVGEGSVSHAAREDFCKLLFQFLCVCLGDGFFPAGTDCLDL